MGPPRVAQSAPSALILLLLDGRSPAGAHSHSSGMEPAVTAGLVRDIGDLEAFCRGRLRTSGRVAASFAASACQLWLEPVTAGPVVAPGADGRPDGVARTGHGVDGSSQWELLDAELDARTPSEAARASSRQLGGGLRRLLHAMLPSADLTTRWVRVPRPAPHHPLVLGAAVALAGGDAALAARAAALASVTAPASAAVRLLGLDPLAVHGMLARLAPAVDECGSEAAGWTGTQAHLLPPDGAPFLDLLADVHRAAEVRLFAS